MPKSSRRNSWDNHVVQLYAASRAGRSLLFGLITSLCLCLGSACSFGQDLEIRIYGTGDGFPTSVARDLGQDSDGRLWLAGAFGIRHFDGRDIEAVVLDQSASTGQTALRWDQEAVLWSVAAQTPFSVVRHLSTGLEALPLVAASSTSAVLTGFEVVGSATAEVALATTEGLLMWRQADWSHLTVADGLPDNRIQALAQWGGRLVAGGPSGLALIRAGFVDLSLTQRLQAAPSRDIQALATQGRGEDESLWLIGDSWIGLLTESDFQLLGVGLDFDFPSTGESSMSAAADGFGGVLVSNSQAISHFHPATGLERWVGHLEVSPIHKIFVDREGLVWVGGEGGVARIASRKFVSYRESNGLFDDSVSAILERRNGAVVLGHRGGVSFIDDGIVETRYVPLLTADGKRLGIIEDLAETPDGRLWLAAGPQGLGEWRGDQLIRYGTADGAAGVVQRLAVEPVSEELWAATDRGLLRQQEAGERIRLVPVMGRLPGDGEENLDITGLKAGSNGLWVLTRAGLSFLHGESSGLDRYWQAENAGLTLYDVALPSRSSEDEPVWLATSDGLYVGAETGRLEAYEHPGLRQSLFSIAQDGDRLWLGSGDGAFRFKPKQSSSLESLTLEQRLAGSRATVGGAMKDGLGRVWIATDRGVSIFDRNDEQTRAEPPQPKLLELVSGDLSWSLSEPQRLPAGIDQLVFRFRIASLLPREQILVRSRLEGLEDEWSPLLTAENLERRYFDLPPGEYRLHLRAMSSVGGWSSVVSSEQIALIGPFWRQTWFFGIFGAGVLAGLFILQTVLTQRRHSLLLEEEVAQRVAELQTSEDRYRKTFKTIEDGVVTTDERGRVALMNPRAQQMTGWSEPDAIGQSIDTVLKLFQVGVGDQVGPAVSLLSSELQDTIGPTQTAVLESRVGQRRTAELAASPIVSRGVGFAGLVFTFRDISRKREIEAELARAHKLEAIGLLAGGIAHDFNNLLTVIMGSLSLILETSHLEAQQRALLNDAENALIRARDLTQQLLTFSRGGAPVRETASITEVIADSASFVLRGSKVRCEVDLPDDLYVVDIDAGQISQVLNNLLINAGQAMTDGGTVRVIGRNVHEVPQPLRPSAHIAIEVIDTGIGIPEHLIHKVFDPYFSTKQEGRGLGLASAYSIAKSHDGLLTVKSALGEGTTFTLFLPASEETQVAKPDLRETHRFEGGGRVLVMDDDPVVRRTTGVMLEKLGFEVTFAVDGHQALNLYARNMEAESCFRAVMMDLTVPGGMGGQEAIQHILQLDPDVPGIVYSGYSNDPVLANYRDYGFRGRLSKPFRLSDLQAVLAEVLLTEANDRDSQG